MFPDLLRDDVFRLETRRLWLRWPRAGDVSLVARLAGERGASPRASVRPLLLPARAFSTNSAAAPGG